MKDPTSAKVLLPLGVARLAVGEMLMVRDAVADTLGEPVAAALEGEAVPVPATTAPAPAEGDGVGDRVPLPVALGLSVPLAVCVVVMVPVDEAWAVLVPLTGALGVGGAVALALKDTVAVPVAAPEGPTVELREGVPLALELRLMVRVGVSVPLALAL